MPEADWTQYQDPRRSSWQTGRAALVPTTPPRPSALQSIPSLTVVTTQESVPTPTRVPRALPRASPSHGLLRLMRLDLRRRLRRWIEAIHRRVHGDERLMGALAVAAAAPVVAMIVLMSLKLWLALGALAGLALLIGQGLGLASWRRARHQALLLREGQPRRAQLQKIEAHPELTHQSVHVTFTYTDLSGLRRQHTEAFGRDELGGSLRVGSPFEVLIHPEIPGFVAPFLQGISLVGADARPAPQEPPPAPDPEQDEESPSDQEIIEDLRPERLAPDPPPGARAPTLDLKLWTHPAPTTVMGRLRALWRQRQAGALLLDDETLRWRVGERQGELPVDAPWVVHLSARLRPEAMAELNLTLRPIGLPPTQARAHTLKLKVRLPQRQLRRDLPIKWETCPHLQPRDFAPLWEALRHHAATHGRTLEGVTATPD